MINYHIFAILEWRMYLCNLFIIKDLRGAAGRAGVSG